MNPDQLMVENLRRDIGDKWPDVSVRDAYIFLVTEMGEVGDVLLRLGHGDNIYARNHDKEVSVLDLTKELGDVYLMLCSLASIFNIDLSEAVWDRICHFRNMYK